MRTETKKVGLIFLCIILLVLPFAAANTTIKVHTIQGIDLNVSLAVTNVNSGVATVFEDNATDANGDYYASYGADSGAISVYVVVRQNGRISLEKYYNSTANGGTIYFDVFEMPTTPSAPVTTTPTTNTTNNSGTLNLTTTQNTTVVETKDTTKSSLNLMPILTKIGIWAFYIVAGVVILLVLFFGGKYIIKKVKTMNLGTSGAKNDDIRLAPNPKLEKELADAERKIKEAQGVIDNIRNRKQKLSDAERRFEEAKRELDRIKKGY